MQRIIAANWKMFKTQAQALETAQALQQKLPANLDRKVIIFPPFTAISTVAQAIKGAGFMAVGGQNMYPAAEGAFTGEISPLMLQDAGAQWVLIGHSERRHIMGETFELIQSKVSTALENKLNVLLCVGETLQEREQGQLSAVLTQQLTTAIENVKQQITPVNFAIAYEPVWAIGTGKVAGPAEITDAHAMLHALLQAQLPAIADQLPLLYGGSVKPDNAGSILSIAHVDGLLVGGASLKADSFAQIVCA